MRLAVTFTLLFLGTALSNVFAQQYPSNSASSQQTGVAVYYADYLHGRITAMGEVYRRDEYTAAHKTLPKGTLLRVTRLDNNLSTVVRVNDRGPFDEGVLIDLSKVAAMDIGLLKDGRATVQIEVVGYSETNPRSGRLPGALTAKSAPAQQQPQQPQGYASYGASSYRPQAQSEPRYYASRQYPAAAASTPQPIRQAAARNNDLVAKGGAPVSYNQQQSQRINPADAQVRNWEQQLQIDRYSNQGLQSRRPGSTYEEPVTSPQQAAMPQGYSQVGGGLAARAPGTQLTAKSAAPAASSRAESGKFAIQLASYQNPDNANRQVNELKAKGFEQVYLWKKGGLNKVVIASFRTKQDAQQYLDNIRRDHLMDGLVIPVQQ